VLLLKEIFGGDAIVGDNFPKKQDQKGEIRALS
jgi:hypothetical protein